MARKGRGVPQPGCALLPAPSLVRPQWRKRLVGLAVWSRNTRVLLSPDAACLNGPRFATPPACSRLQVHGRAAQHTGAAARGAALLFNGLPRHCPRGGHPAAVPALHLYRPPDAVQLHTGGHQRSVPVVLLRNGQRWVCAQVQGRASHSLGGRFPCLASWLPMSRAWLASCRACLRGLLLLGGACHTWQAATDGRNAKMPGRLPPAPIWLDD